MSSGPRTVSVKSAVRDRHGGKRRRTARGPRSTRCRSLPTARWWTHTPVRELLAEDRYEPLHIRPCTTRDRAGVIALWETVFPDDPPHNAPAKVFDAKLAMHDGMLFVATDAESVIGTAMSGYDGHRGWLYTVAVSPGHRRRGVGTALVRHAVAALRTAGCIKVNLQIRSSNLAVRGFYESLGFAAEDRLSMGMHIR